MCGRLASSPWCSWEAVGPLRGGAELEEMRSLVQALGGDSGTPSPSPLSVRWLPWVNCSPLSWAPTMKHCSATGPKPQGCGLKPRKPQAQRKPSSFWVDYLRYFVIVMQSGPKQALDGIRGNLMPRLKRGSHPVKILHRTGGKDDSELQVFKLLTPTLGQVCFQFRTSHIWKW